jgi:hypothetical protein
MSMSAAPATRGVSFRTGFVQILRSPFLCLLVALLMAASAPLPLCAQTPKLASEHHSWAKFKPGAWKRVRVVTESLDEKGEVASTSTTDTTTQLEQVGQASYALAVEVSVEVAGRKFDTPTQLVDQGYFGEAKGQTTATKNSTSSSVLIEGRKIPCRSFEVVIQGGPRRRMAKIYYSDTIAPYVLKRVSVTTDSVGDNVLHETSDTVMAVDMPHQVLSRILPTAHIKTVLTHSKGTTTTLAVHCEDVPGGIVEHTSKEIDAEGRLIRRSTLKLLDYGVEADRQVLRRRRFQRIPRRLQ